MRAVVWIQPGPTAAAKQEQACHDYVIEGGLRLAAIVPARTGSSRDVVAMIVAGKAEVVVCAYGGRTIAAEVIAAGGRVIAVHPTPHVVEPPEPPPLPGSSGGLLARLRAAGKTVEEIARFLDSPTGDIRRILRRGE
jgi:hypothetical protein